jgi:septum site-determining protein MinD
VGVAIVITSGKGGVGKTTTTANLGTALAMLDKKVCLVDTDIGLRNLDLVLGLENRILYDLVDVVEGRCKLQTALIPDKRLEGKLVLLPAAQTKDKSAVSPEQMAQLVKEQLKSDYDYVLIDCPAGIEQGFRNAIAGADRAVVVTTPDSTAVRDADRIIGILEKEANVSPSLIVNRVRPRLMKQEEIMDVDEIVMRLGIDLLGIVPDDEDVITSSNRGEPIVLNPKARAAQAYRNIARRILGESVPLMSLDDKPSVLERVRRIFGLS